MSNIIGWLLLNCWLTEWRLVKTDWTNAASGNFNGVISTDQPAVITKLENNKVGIL
jgi:hypothetical protein